MATGSKKVDMNYANYDTAIVERYKVKLVGWTYEKFVNPSHIGTMTDICRLRDALKCGECKWTKLDKHQLQAHLNDIKNRQGNGEVIGKPRRERSDKGKSRKRKNLSDDEDDENIPPRRTGKQKAGPSKSSMVARKKRKIVESSDNDSTDDSD